MGSINASMKNILVVPWSNTTSMLDFRKIFAVKLATALRHLRYQAIVFVGDPGWEGLLRTNNQQTKERQNCPAFKQGFHFSRVHDKELTKNTIHAAIGQSLYDRGSTQYDSRGLFLDEDTYRVQANFPSIPKQRLLRIPFWRLTWKLPGRH